MEIFGSKTYILLQSRRYKNPALDHTKNIKQFFVQTNRHKNYSHTKILENFYLYIFYKYLSRRKLESVDKLFFKRFCFVSRSYRRSY